MPSARAFTQGGVQVDPHRTLTAGSPIRPLFLPSVAVVPLVQYPGARADWVVAAGDSVAEDQVLARGVRPEDLPVHSPIPGRVTEFREVTLPGGTVCSAALIRLEGEFRRTGRPSARKEWTGFSVEELQSRIRDSGIILQSSPLDPRRSLDGLRVPLDHLVINGLQPEPYLTLALHLQSELGNELVEGIRILQTLLRPQRTHFAADPDQPEDWLRHFGLALDGVELHALPFKYPQAQEGVLLKTLGLAEVSGAAARIVILDTASVLAIRDAVVEGKPQVERTVVVSGQGVRRPGAYRVRIGTPLVHLLRDAGGLKAGEHKVLMGGPFLGQVVENLGTPVLKSTQAVLVLQRHEVNEGRERDCIRCGACVETCPVGLEPLNLHKALVQGDLELARTEGLDWCIGCGVCSYVCPSRLPLAALFHSAQEAPHAV